MVQPRYNGENRMESEHRDSNGRFKPGCPAGPGPASRRLLLTPHLIRELEKIHKETGKTNGQVIAERVVSEAIAGEEWAIKLTWERTEGKVREQSQDDQTPRNPIRLLNLGDDEAA